MSIQGHAIVVFTHDRNGVAIPDATIEAVVGGRTLARATTRGHSDTPVRLQLPANVKTITLRAIAKGRTLEATVAVDVGTHTFRFEEIIVPPKVPVWFPIAGYVSGAATLVFFMAVALAGIKRPTFAHHAVLSLGAALSFTFIGGEAAARGTVPIPGLKENPIAFSVAGGIAVFVIVLLLLRYLWPLTD